MRKPQPAAQAVSVQPVSAPQPAVAAAPVPAPASDAMASNIPPAEQPKAPVTHQPKPSPARSHHERPAPRMVAQVHTPPVVQQPVQQPVPVNSAEQTVAPAPAPAPAVQAETAPPAPPPPQPNSVTVTAGTTLSVRLGETLSTERNHDGDTFVATLDQPLVVDGFVIAERGARAQGRIVQSLRSGKVQGLAKLGVELTQITTSDGQRVKINTGAYEREADPNRRNDAAKVGGGAALGAIIGAIAGGGKGAAIGAGVGGAAGAGDVALTRGKAVELAVETRLSFRLKEPVTITEQLK